MMNNDLLEFESVKVSRRATGSYDQDTGYYTQGELTEFTIDASVQPASGREIEQLAEGDRIRNPKMMFTKTKIELNDYIEYDSEL